MGNGLPRRHEEHKGRLKVIKNRIKRIANRVRGWGIWITNPCRLPFVPSLVFNALYSLRHCGELNCCTKERLRRIYYTILWTFVLGMFCTTLYAHSDGVPLSCLGAGVDKFNVTYAAPSMFTCGQLGCHYQYPINSGKEKLKLFVVDKCTPGEVVDILISFEKAKSDFHGFQITAQDSYFGNRLVGTFINVGDDEDTQIEAGGRFATHTKKGTQQKFWHVKWQAPPADFWVANPVKFYAMGAEADNDGTAMGDYIYKATRLLVIAPKKTEKGRVRAAKKE